MAEPSLSIPILFGASLPTTSPELTIPACPTHAASWIIPSSGGAGPSRRTALADQDNTIWIISSPVKDAESSVSCPSVADQLLSPEIPSIQTLAASSPTSPVLSARRSRPTTQRNLSYSGRPRNTSSASSILSTATATGSGSGKRRTSAFSPPPSALQLPTTTLSSAVASAAPPDSHTHRASTSDRNDLREALREHKERKDDSSIVGLGIAGIARRGLTGVHGKEDHTDHSGAASPKSAVSSSTEGTARFGLFGRNSVSTDGEREKELRDQMVEVEVEREMERERMEDLREKEDFKVVEAAIERSPTPANTFDGIERVRSEAGPTKRDIRRFILREAGRGQIVAFRVYEEIDALCVLRDEGLLDVFSLSTLQCTGVIDLETPEEAKPTTEITLGKDKHRLSSFWHWRGVHLAQTDNTYLLISYGVPWPCALPSPNGEVTRVVMAGPSSSGTDVHIAARLELPGEGDTAVCRSKETNYLLHSTSTSLTSYPIIFPSQISQHPTPRLRASPQVRAASSTFPTPYLRSSTPDPSHHRETSNHGLRKSASHTHLQNSVTSPLLGSSAESGEHDKAKDKEKGFAKFLAARRADWGKKGKEEDKPDEPSPGVGEGKEVERDGGGGWEKIEVASGHGVGWKGDALDVFSFNGLKLNVRGTITLPSTEHIQDAVFSTGLREIVVRTMEHTYVYHARPLGPEKGKSMNFIESCRFDDDGHITLASNERLLRLRPHSVDILDLARPNANGECLAKLSPLKDDLISHICPSSVENVAVADKRGNVSAKDLSALFGDALPAESVDQISSDRLESPITYISTIPGLGVSNKYLIAGDEDGAVRMWTTEPFKLCGSWTLFAEPVQSVALLDMPQAGPLQDCLLVTSREGTVGLISLKEMDDLFLIPASRTPLRRVFIESKDILLAYANGKARVWNTQTQEFRRSTGVDAADDMLSSGDWAEVTLDGQQGSTALRSVIPSASHRTELGRLLNFDLRELDRWLQSSKNNPNHSPLAALRNLLSIFLTFGVNADIDEVCTSKLDIRKPKISIIVGQSSDANVAELSYSQLVDAWTISPTMTGLRQLVIIALLRPFLDSPDHERWAAEVIAFYTASLPLNVIEPDLDFFANYYMDTSSDVHQAARMLFAARVARMTKPELEVAVEVGLPSLPSRLTAATRSNEIAGRALTLLGGIALHKYQSLQSTTLKAIAESVSLFLHEPKPAHLSLAVEICSKGFTTWQSYVDPSDLLRRLFHLATHKDFAASTASSSPNGGGSSIAAQARLAVLHVASTNPPLFMSTLSMDILDAKSAEGRNSIMKLCVFMARKKPAVLENGLPRIAEAVVKSLDPNVGKMRDDVWQAATVILNELVLAFSTIDFHSGTQRLAVGTHEGATIMYDLKTASRLYVIEPHKHPVSAVTFSPDGRRLITVSLEEGNVTVWKVGSSLSGFFNVGAPPRQGGEKGEPFKRIEFIRADDGPLDSTSALSDIQISWPGPRQARVMIKETALTFET